MKWDNYTLSAYTHKYYGCSVSHASVLQLRSILHRLAAHHPEAMAIPALAKCKTHQELHTLLDLTYLDWCDRNNKIGSQEHIEQLAVRFYARSIWKLEIEQFKHFILWLQGELK